MADPAGPLGWRKAIEWWYLALTLVSATTAGIAPILVPLAVVGRHGDQVNEGLVMSAIGLGMLTAPWWGRLADRTRQHRAIIVGGALAAALSMLGYLLAGEFLGWLVCSFVQGVGVSAAFTAANLLIVERHPERQWNERIGWFQTVTTAGTTLGLLIAGGLTHLGPNAGLLIGGGIAVGAAVVGGLTLPKLPLVLPSTPTQSTPVRSTEWAPLHHIHLHAVSAQNEARLLRDRLKSPFSLFLLVWMVSNLGMYALNAEYPVLMKEHFLVDPGVASLALAIATGLGLFLYTPAGRWISRIGAVRLLQSALGGRLGALIGLAALALVAMVGREWLAILAFGGATLAWPLLSVSSTVLASGLTQSAEGEGMGTYSASTALAGLIGPAAGGWISDQFGFSALTAVAATGLAGAWLLSGLLRPKAVRPAAEVAIP